MPADLSLEAGADAPFDIRLYHRGNASLRIDSVDLIRLGDLIGRTSRSRMLRPIAAPAPRGPLTTGRRKLVIIGNCQSETLRQGFVRIEPLNRLFEVKYHFVQLPKNLHEFAARDLESCDIVMVQDIRLWDEFPLRIPCGRGPIVRFPLVRFASPWPFDTWNGPGDPRPMTRRGRT